MMTPKGQLRIASLQNIYRVMKGYVHLLKACLSDFSNKNQTVLISLKNDVFAS